MVQGLINGGPDAEEAMQHNTQEKKNATDKQKINVPKKRHQIANQECCKHVHNRYIKDPDRVQTLARLAKQIFEVTQSHFNKQRN